MDQDATGTKVSLGRGDIVLDGNPTPPKKGNSPLLFDHVYCGQTAGWFKMLLVTEVGLSPGDFVFDGAQLPQKKAQLPTQFWPMSIVAKRLDG